MLVSAPPSSPCPSCPDSSCAEGSCVRFRDMGLKMVSCSPKMEPLQKAIAAGYFFNAAQLADYRPTNFSDPGLPRFQLVRKTGIGGALVHPACC